MKNWALYAVTVIVWGSTWIAIEYQLGEVPPEVSIFYRYLLASALLIAWCLATGRRLKFGRPAHRLFLLLGLTLFSLNYVLAYYAQEHITSALTAIVFSTMLWMNIVNSRIFFGLRAPRAVIGGSVLGIAGISILFMPQVNALSLEDATLYGTSLAILSALVASFGNMVSQAAQKHDLPIIQSNAWGMFYGTLITGLVALVQGQDFAIDRSATYLASLTYLAVVGSIVGFGAYLTLLGRIGAGKAGYAMVMFPVVAIILSVVVGEIRPDWNLFFGVCLVVSGNVFVLRAGGGAKASEGSTPVPGRLGRSVLQKPR